MYEAAQSAMTSDRGIKWGSSFQARDRVWVKRLNKMGVVQEVRRCRNGGVEYDLLRVVVAGTGLVSVLANPLSVEKGL